MYTAFTPGPLLAPYIDAYWIAGTQLPGSQRILPDTCADIIFNISAQPVQTAGCTVQPFRAFAVGTMTTFSDSCLCPGARLLGIRFKPGGMAAFTGLPMHLLTDEQALLEELSLPAFSALQQKLESAGSIQAMLRATEHFLLQRLPTPDVQGQRVAASVALIREKHGLVAPATLAEQVHMSLRSFERLFLQQVGTTPKTFTRIVRCLGIKKALRHKGDESLLGLALQYGFYDHAHFTKEFRAIMGYTPGSYVAR